MRPVCMEEWEIVDLYKHSGNKNKQIRILAQLNLVNEMDICDLLYKKGALVVQNYGYSLRYMIARMLAAKASDTEIRKELSAPQNQIDITRNDPESWIGLFGNDETHLKGIYKENESLFEQLEVLQK